MIASTLLIATTLTQAQTPAVEKITSFTVTELPVTAAEKSFGQQVGGMGSGGATGITNFPTSSLYSDPTTPPSTNERIGQVISTAKDVVALGEAIYTLVQKGKPSNTTEYAPVRIVPRDQATKEHVDPFDLENCAMPTTKKYVASIKSGSKEVVRFEYMVIYTVGCSYNGTGKWIESAMVQPVSVKTGFGWDFTATMKLSGIMNHGSKTDPVAGALLTMKYQMNSWSTSFERNDTIHITGRGELKTY